MITIIITILSWVAKFITQFIDMLPSFNIPVLSPTEFRDFITGLYFFLPMDTIGVLFGITIVLTNFRYIYGILLKLKSFIPFISG